MVLFSIKNPFRAEPLFSCEDQFFEGGEFRSKVIFQFLKSAAKEAPSPVLRPSRRELLLHARQLLNWWRKTSEGEPVGKDVVRHPEMIEMVGSYCTAGD